MSWVLDLHPIRFFSFYLMLIFVLGTFTRFRQYRIMLALLVGLRSRWPNLARLVLAHRHIFLTWSTLRPLVIVLVLLLANLLASRLVWPGADEFLASDLVRVWPAVPFVVLTGTAMLAFDLWGVLRVGEIDQPLLEKYFDQAEFWLKGWQAPVVRFISLGYVNPRQMVDREVRSALESASGLLNSNLWWISIQTTLRILFGLTLWSSCALEAWLRGLVGG